MKEISGHLPEVEQYPHAVQQPNVNSACLLLQPGPGDAPRDGRLAVPSELDVSVAGWGMY